MATPTPTVADFQKIDWAALWAKAPQFLAIFLELLKLLSEQPAPAMKAAATCPDDACECCDAAIAHQIESLGCMLKCRCCCEK